MRPASFRGLTLGFVLLIVLATVITGIAAYYASVSTIRHLVDQRLSLVSTAIAPEGTAHDTTTLIQGVADMTGQRDTGDIGILLLGAGGERIAGNVRLNRVLPPGLSSMGADDHIAGLTSGRAFVREVGGGRRLVVVAETEPFDQYDGARLLIYLGGFGSIILIVLLGVLLFGRLVGARIAEVRRTVDTIIGGDMDRRIPVIGDGSAFDEQARAFNGMLDRIQQLMEEVRNVSNDISHELRTPLTRLRGKLALLRDHRESGDAPGGDAGRMGLGGALEDVDDLLAMFNAILRIAEIESGERRKGFARLDLGALAAEIVAVMEPVAEESGHRLSVGDCAPVVVQGDRQLLTQLLINLVENALRHAPAPARIRVSVRDGGAMAELVIVDDGPGIAANLRDVAMRRFGRLEQLGKVAGVAPSTSAPPPAQGLSGHGLGLPLVDAIARLHGGEMALADAGPGLKVTVMLCR